MDRISYKQFDDAVQRVIDKLDDLGVYLPRLTKVSVWLTPAGISHGLFWLPRTAKRYGAITIPRWLFRGPKRDNRSLQLTLLHEYGHALAFNYPQLVRERKFAHVFGGPYKRMPGYRPDLTKQPFISQFAPNGPEEDFCEVFAHLVLGVTRRLGAEFHKKFSYVGDICAKAQCIG